MKKKLVFSLLVIFVSLELTLPLLAQQAAPTGPPNVLWMLREELKPAKGGPHVKVETRYAQLFKKAKLPTGWLGMTAVLGPNYNEALFTTGYESFAALEKERAAVDKMTTGAVKTELDQLDKTDSDIVSAQRTVATVYRKEMSYRANIDLPHMRYFAITTIRVRPGHNNDYEEIRKMVNAAHEKANVDEHWAIFQAVSGTPNGTFYQFVPMKSLAEYDAGPTLHGKAYPEALGEENMKKIQKLQSDAILSTETSVYAFNPHMSMVPKEWVDADSDFWDPKAAAPPKPAAKAAEKSKS